MMEKIPAWCRARSVVGGPPHRFLTPLVGRSSFYDPIGEESPGGSTLSHSRSVLSYYTHRMDGMMRKYSTMIHLFWFLCLCGCPLTAAWSPHPPQPLGPCGSHSPKPQEQSSPFWRLGEEQGGLVLGGTTGTHNGSKPPQPPPQQPQPQRGDGGRRAALFSVVLTATTAAMGGCHGRFVVPGAWAVEGPAAAATATGTSTTTRTVYKSGKTPMVPGVPPREKSDVKGTKKDPDFLRSISDCKSQCQSVGDGSFAKSKEDCLSECQDICCRTYEQCTFDIVPRI